MKHLIETTDLSSLGNAKYDRLILDSNTNEIIYKGGGVKYEYVDLGLPSGLKWAKCNVGAETETDYGDYFMWGSTTPNTADNCSWESYKYSNGSFDTLTKYCNNSSYGTVDDKTTLDTEDDAAIQIMGGNWRMPTQSEIQELINNTTNKWVTNYNGSGVNGMKFTSKTDTSKYIFIPASGVRSGSSCLLQGDDCRVWSSSLNTSNPSSAWYLILGPDDARTHTYNRQYGFVVRGVL